MQEAITMDVFSTLIQDELQKRMDSVTIEIIKGPRRNGQTTKQLIIKDEKSSGAPAQDLDSLLKTYNNGMSFDEVLNHIISTYNAYKSQGSGPDITDWKYAKDHLHLRLINKTNNFEVLFRLAYATFGDIAITFSIEIDSDLGPEYASTVSVTKDLLALWRKTTKDLFDAAKKPKAKIATAREAVSELTDIDGEYLNGVLILTDESPLNGAKAILDAKGLKKLHKKIGDFLLIPTSIHDWMILHSDMLKEPGIPELILTVSNKAVPKDEFLSSHVYSYRDGKLYIDSSSEELTIEFD